MLMLLQGKKPRTRRGWVRYCRHLAFSLYIEFIPDFIDINIVEFILSSDFDYNRFFLVKVIDDHPNSTNNYNCYTDSR